MKNSLNYLLLTLLTAWFAGCTNEPELALTDVGPKMEVISYDKTAVFGGAIRFEASLTDKLPLSTLKAQLFFDDEMVAEEVIRTKTNGTYEGSVVVPFYRLVPNGEATIRFVGQNTHFGLTTIEYKVPVARPDLASIIYVLNDTEYVMERTGLYEYAVTDNFPQKPKGYIKTPELDPLGNFVTFGYAEGQVATDSTDPIPFSNSNAGVYTITFNTHTFEGSPFLKLMFNGSEMTMLDGDNYFYTTTLTKGSEYELTGIFDFDEWNIDCDYFERTEAGKLKFLPMSGMYTVTANFEFKFLRIETMKSATELATLNADCSGAIWAIGDESIGKPSMKNGASWSPEKGGLCAAPIAKGTYQLTLVAGISLHPSKFDFKFFHQKTWGGEFTGKATTEAARTFVTTNSDLVKISESGNCGLVEGKSFELGGIYRFTVQFGADITTAALTVEKIGEQPLPPVDIKINGTALTMVDADNYAVDLDLTQGGAITMTGADAFTPAWMNGNFFSLSGSNATLAPLSGKYRILVNKTSKLVDALPLTADGSGLLTLDKATGHGAIYYIGYGLGAAAMEEPAWTTEKGICIPEVASGIFKMTAKAGLEGSKKLGERFRVSGWDGKFFIERGWGGLDNPPTVAADSQDILVIKSGGNIGIKEGTTLEEGATYELTVSFVVDPANPVISFVKK